jgi:hypothetical protein
MSLWQESDTGFTLTGDEFVAEVFRAAGSGWTWKITEGDHTMFVYCEGIGDKVDTCKREAEAHIAARELK